MSAAAIKEVELRIQGPLESQSLRHALHPGDVLRIGRAPREGCAVPWDQMISREHADLEWTGERLLLRCQDSARNPVLLGSRSARTAELLVGQQFRIGSTTFVLSWPHGSGFKTVDLDLDFDSEMTMASSEQAYSSTDLRAIQFADASRQLEILARLPSVIAATRSDSELAAKLARLLLDAISDADCVAVIQVDLNTIQKQTAEPFAPLMLQVDTRDGYRGRFRPSRRLIARAFEIQRSLIHEWDNGSTGTKYTVSDGLAWALCTPLRAESCPGWCLYVAGRRSVIPTGPDSLKSDLRFTELVAQFIGSIRNVRQLQEQTTQLSTFFSPKVMESLTGRDAANVLQPAERNVSALFCDVRGFSQKSESLATDLQALLRSVREALGAMSKGILDHDGVIADFQGDAALGFWGWPDELGDGPLPACRAALAIHRGFLAGAADPKSLLCGFSVGIGIVYGRAIAGQIGTPKQAKVGVFGPVVNQGARLEGLSKQLGVAICIDEATAQWVTKRMPPTEARVRRLARVKPVGMSAALNAYQLVPAETHGVVMNEKQLIAFDAAHDAIVAGHWKQAREVLTRLPKEDGPTQFLLKSIGLETGSPPDDWDGAIRLERK